MQGGRLLPSYPAAAFHNGHLLPQNRGNSVIPLEMEVSLLLGRLSKITYMGLEGVHRGPAEVAEGFMGP